MADSEEVALLRRRARRRLVGAVALVVFVAIALPMVLEKEPGSDGQDLAVQIPSQDAGSFKSRVVAPTPEERAPTKAGPAANAVSDSATTAAKSQPGSKKESSVAPSPAASSASPAAPTDSRPAVRAGDAPASFQAGTDDASRAQALLEGGGAWFVTMGTFSNRSNAQRLTEKLAALGIKNLSESVKGDKGEQTRVRAGPFDTKAQAEKVRERLAASGLRPGPVNER